MNLLFLTLSQFDSVNERGIYTDLLRVFAKDGHSIYVISPTERRDHQKTHINRCGNATILRLRIGNTQKTHIIEKGISTVLIEPTFIRAIKQFFSNVRFDLIIYTTPPITFVGAIEYVKKRDNAKTYLLLKDIFPQNAIDLGMLTRNGIKGLLYKHFRKQEKELYRISDRIGCMSPANVDYVLEHNKEVRIRNNVAIKQTGKPIVEECPNSIEPIDMGISAEERNTLRDKYNLPQEKKIFVYGGNLGKPQGIPFMLECLEACRDIDDVYFLIVGSGTEYPLIEDYINRYTPQNVILYQALPRKDYDQLVAACDVGMIFLDHRFTIPNFPSRLLAYMQAKVPVLAVTDSNTDIRNIITGIDRDGNKTHEPFGWWCESENVDGFISVVDGTIMNTSRNDMDTMGTRAFDYLKKNYNVINNIDVILD